MFENWSENELREYLAAVQAAAAIAWGSLPKPQDPDFVQRYQILTHILFRFRLNWLSAASALRMPDLLAPFVPR